MTYRPPETIKCAGCGWDSKIPVINLYCPMKDLKCPKCGCIVIHAHRTDLDGGKSDYKYRSSKEVIY